MGTYPNQWVTFDLKVDTTLSMVRVQKAKGHEGCKVQGRRNAGTGGLSGIWEGRGELSRASRAGSQECSAALLSLIPLKRVAPSLTLNLRQQHSPLLALALALALICLHCAHPPLTT